MSLPDRPRETSCIGMIEGFRNIELGVLSLSLVASFKSFLFLLDSSLSTRALSEILSE